MKGYVYITGTGTDPSLRGNLNDPLLSKVPTLGACMPNIRRFVTKGDWIFIISGKVVGAEQYVVGGLQVEEKIDALLALKAEGVIGFIADGEMPAARVLGLLDQHGLGAGETESIVACEALGYGFCSDDGQARKLAERLLGSSRVTGSLRLLRWCVEEQLVQCEAAFSLFKVMLASGGFLPSMRQEFFCTGGPDC